jgi:hypothetical protein
LSLPIKLKFILERKGVPQNRASYQRQASGRLPKTTPKNVTKRKKRDKKKRGTGKILRGLKAKDEKIAGKINKNPKNPSKKPLQLIVCGKKTAKLTWLLARKITVDKHGRPFGKSHNWLTSHSFPLKLSVM